MDSFYGYGVDLGGEIDISTEAFSVAGVIRVPWRDGLARFLCFSVESRSNGLTSI
jgi:hypothetical protein